MPFSFENMNSYEGISAGLAKRGKKIDADVFEELEDIVIEIIGDIQDNYVPIDTHTLQISGRINEKQHVNQYLTTINFGFGGEGSGAEHYALIQHEDLGFKHKHGGAKYVELAVEDWQKRITRRIGKRVEAAVMAPEGSYLNPSGERVQDIF